MPNPSAPACATQHFQQMAALVEALKPLPAELLEHHFHGETFGSWWILLRHQGVRMQLAFDGRDHLLSLRCSSTRKHSDDWGREVWTKLHRERVIPVEEIVTAIRDAITNRRDT